MKNSSIVIITKNFVNGGTERRAVLLANQFADNGYKVSFLVTNKCFSETFYVLNPSVEFIDLTNTAQLNCAVIPPKIYLNWIRGKIKLFKCISHFFGFLSLKKKQSECALIIKELRKRLYQSLRVFFLSHKKSTIISFNNLINETLLLAIRGLKCKYISSFINTVNDEDIPLLQSIYLHKPDLCVFQTHVIKDIAESYLQLKGVVIYNPILANLSDSFSGNRKKTIVNFCRLDSQKNLFLLVNAFKKVVLLFPDYQLVIYGIIVTATHEKYKEELLSYIKQLNLTNNVQVVNAVSNVHEKIRDCAMYVSSSDYEGLSNSMIEAMALGLPCVCTDCLGGGAREMINDGENGLLVPRNDPEKMSSAIIRFIKDKDFAEKCGKKASLIRDELSVDRIISQWIEVIESI